MKLVIISPVTLEEYSIHWIELNTNVGNFVILPAHAPTILVLNQDEPITFELSNGKQESFIVRQGVVEITRSSVTLLIDQHTP